MPSRRLKVRPSPSFGNKLLRALWRVVWVMLYRPSPTLMHGWRRSLLRIFGAEIGSHAMPYPGAYIWAPWNLRMGARSCIADGVDCYNVDMIELGPRAIVSQRAFLCTASHDCNVSGFPLVTAPISIEEDAWVAAEAFIGPGVRIATGAVVGARGVVLSDVAQWEIVAGNPAKGIGARNKGNQNQLLGLFGSKLV